MGTYPIAAPRPARLREPPPRPATASPQLIVLAGPNGAGKSTAAPELLRDVFHMRTFVNADEIARGLSAFAPDRAALAAGRVMLARLRVLEQARSDFAFETTLSGIGARRLIQRSLGDGYQVHLVYLWLRSPELALDRVRTRVAAGGHDVPAVDVRRRFARGLTAFATELRGSVTTWRAFDAGTTPPRLIAAGVRGTRDHILDPSAWAELARTAGVDDPEAPHDA